MQRRNFIKSSGALMSTLPILSFNSFNVFSGSPLAGDDVIRIKIGDMDCTIFRDMMFKYLAKDFFINADQQDLNRSLDKYNATPDNIPSPFIALFIQHGNKRILVDTGVGYLEKPFLFSGTEHIFQGKLHQLMREQAIKKEDVTDVIITHFHPDHVGGIFSEEGSLNFPNARFHMHEDEWNYWHSSQSVNQPPMFGYFIERNITKLKDHNLNLIKGDFVEIVPGVTAVKADGHTPGQIALDIHHNKEHLLYISDAFLHPLHIEKIDWRTNYDQDHEKAKKARIKLLELAYKDHMLVNAFHFDFPGLGRVEKSHNNWIWKYSTK